MNYSLWHDEACLALAIIETPFSMLHMPLPYEQAAPYGYLLLVKALVNLFNEKEITLRLLSLVAGISLLPLFYTVSKKVFNQTTALFTLSLLCIGQPFIDFSVEFKPYILDAFLSLFVTYTSLLILDRINSSEKIKYYHLLLFLVTPFSMWFSFTTIFVCVSTMLFFWVYYFIHKPKSQLTHLIIFSVIILANFFIVNQFHLQNIRNSSALHGFWKGEFVPFPLSFDAIKWLIHKPFSIVEYPLGFTLSGIALLCILSGCISLAKHKPFHLILLISPIVITIGASLFSLYPFEGRLIFFLTPLLLLLLGSGAIDLYRLISCKNQSMATSLMILLLLFPLFECTKRAIRPFRHENLRPVVEEVIDKRKKNEEIYVYYGGLPAYRYYARLLDFSAPFIPGIQSRDDWSLYNKEISTVLHKGEQPIWFIFSHVWDCHGVNEEKYFITEINKHALLQAYIHAIGGASAYLYAPKGIINDKHAPKK